MNTFTYLPKDNRAFEKGRQYIGASAMPTLFGLLKHRGQTPLTFWQEFTGRRERFRGNWLTADGHWHEDGILARYVKDYTNLNWRAFWISRLAGETQFANLHSFTEARHPDYEYAVAHADLVQMDDEPVIIQAKNTGFFAARRNEDKNKGYDKEDRSQNGIPLGVYLQEQWEMFCYGVSTAYVTPQIDGHPGYLYGPIEYKKSIVEKCLALADRMWWHIQNDTPPRPETWPDVVSLFPDLKEGTAAVIGGRDYEDMLQMREQLRAINRTIAHLQEKKTDIQNATGLLIGGNEILRAANGDELAKAYIKSGQWRADLKALKDAHPRTYRNLIKEGIIRQDSESRMLSIAGTKISGAVKCKQCGGDAGEKKIVKRDGRKIVYGPFCPACWQKIKESMEDKND
jgi:hypothetical protein